VYVFGALLVSVTTIVIVVTDAAAPNVMADDATPVATTFPFTVITPAVAVGFTVTDVIAVNTEPVYVYVVPDFAGVITALSDTEKNGVVNPVDVATANVGIPSILIVAANEITPSTGASPIFNFVT